MLFLLLLNSLSALAALAASLLAFFRPAVMLRGAQPGESGIFYARMYAAHAVLFVAAMQLAMPVSVGSGANGA
ncbi:Uncharacterised protein [Kingella potus]|uniref:Uncharacterized protein n=1 Tax=Kingella potus TaxID=265175 RepID=A0A377QZJ1_9NEIS|nr:hypothetical protein [Kingella potus]UOP01705.1 hypothetical protein LVJ84_06160 [Kingella potus]STQ99988.1 Uncharacterised protein [Kingella potus]